MNGIDIVMIITIILFAKLGVRLVVKYNKLKKEDENNVNSSNENNNT